MENEVRAHLKYKDDPIYIKGRVKNVSLSIVGDPIVSFFSNNDYMPELRATFSDDDLENIAELNQNDIINIICYGSVLTAIGASIKDCYMGDNIRKKVESGLVQLN